MPVKFVADSAITSKNKFEVLAETEPEGLCTQMITIEDENDRRGLSESEQSIVIKRTKTKENRAAEDKKRTGKEKEGYTWRWYWKW